MVLVRRRYYFWLIKAYVRRWRRTIITSVILGVLFFFLVISLIRYYVLPVIGNSYEKIGFAGSYTLDSMPDQVLSYLSYGLTTIAPNGEVKPGAAQSWNVTSDGKTYVFTLKDNLKLGNGETFTSTLVPYSFQDVHKTILSPTKIEFKIKEPYAPFLTAVSKPILIKNYGLKDFHIAKVDQDSGFLKDMVLSNKDGTQKKLIYFYPTQDALMTAFMLGEVNKMENVTAASGVDTQFKNWGNASLQKNVDYSSLVTIFFNTLDNTLANKKVRQALVYALPKSFSQGERSYSFVAPTSIYYTKSPNEGLADNTLAKSLLSAANVANVKLTLTVSEDLLPVAKTIAASWKKIGASTTITTTNDIPATYQAFMYSMQLPKDPDMYTLWHSGQQNNITHYNNVRIDKLLEEGRQAINTTDRVQIYSDLEKYLLDDAPAAFLYFPYSYTVTR